MRRSLLMPGAAGLTLTAPAAADVSAAAGGWGKAVEVPGTATLNAGG
jgi:hypothetical protein